METTLDDARQFLKKCREENDRQSEKIVELFEDVIQPQISKLGDEQWIIYEQAALASFDIKKHTNSTACVRKLSRQYPGSHRVRKLKAMQFEALGSYEDATKIYDALLAEDETNAQIHKRKIAILKAQGKMSEAIDKLCEYLKKFQSDSEAWLELSNLYIEENDFVKAAFCLEELVMTQPHNHLYHQRLAELLYLTGTPENVESARAYFAQALKLNKNNQDALFGFHAAASWISNSVKFTSQKKKENQKYLDWATAQIKTLYEKSTGDIPAKDIEVEDLIAKLHIQEQSDPESGDETSEREK